ncbi:SusC/RagA family TonB-linked outer membrane protein [Flagellimonas zhangzhouensis]|uniref:TonB-linked outer membrane protein, SusC/RagA family n=1 Tax=Flagellimonas zhangzhouensis TaxID=1073328 RepID=A0A1H2YNY5_9FLAO|nr:TonB-dependent receptor [Allomuricauda zhangzhouensis]SDR01691.1 TonB-linked outer membrane protein, SusC/RagA family [Allomuricauda zhangzhouensis]SDX06219.1 TonB-linked outer membrane protein, SusC/RagA family [Allomuricauda zhangzhouensis]
MKTKQTLWLMVLLCTVLCGFTANAQQRITVRGTVSDAETGQPLPGVTVLEQGTTNGTSADFDGNYSIEVNSNAVLTFSSVGYAAQNISVNGRSQINISMAIDSQQLDEVVIVGYGTQTSRKVTGAVQQIDSEELADIPVPQVTQKLQGRLVGVQINQTTGKPGQGIQVRVRGQASILAGSDPLYVVDGFPIVGDISSINPDEIESISVLKDAASTSLYGSRAANGVVLITTKSGKTEQGGFSISYYGGVQAVPQKGRPDLMNGTEFAQFKKESFEDLGLPVPEPFQNPEQYGEGYNWYDAMFRTAPIQSLNINWNARGERSSVAIVAGVFNQEGVMVNSDFKRYSLRANSSFKLNDQLNLGVSVAPTYSIDNLPSSDGAFYATNVNAGIPGGLVTNAMQTWPILPYQNEDGSLPLTAWIPGISAFPTPNWYRAAKEITNETKSLRVLGNVFLEYQPIEGLRLKTSINGDFGNSSFFNFSPSTSSTTFAALPPAIPTSIRRESKYLSWLNENTVTYAKSFGDHNFELLGGMSFQKYEADNSQLFLSNFPDDRVRTIQSALNIDRTRSFNNINEWSLTSFFSRLNYDYKGKYLVTFALRRDGSSRFGSNNRWGNFPSVSAGWVFSDESFLENTDWLTFGKVRASYGIIGNNNIGNYTQYALVDNSLNAVFGNSISSGAAVTTLGNSNLGWEKTKQIDLGLDLRFFDDRVEFIYDYYKKNTTDLLFNVNIPQESGFTNFNDNVGELEFWGHEFAIVSRNIAKENFTWNTNFNIAFNRNKVVSLAEGVDRIFAGGGYAAITRPGEPLGQFWGLIHDGVYDNQQEFDSSPKAVESQVGTIKFQDVNGDGVITYGNENDDRTVIGNPFPDYIFGLTNDFRFGNWDASVVISGSVGNDIAVTNDQGTTNLDGVFNVLRDVKDRWRSPENPGSGRYGKTTGATFMERDWFSSRFIEDGSYLTVKNISLGYSFPVKETSFLKKARLYASVQQAFVLTGYRGVNPEISTTTQGQQSNALALGYDWGAYPVPRTYTLGFNLSF